MATSYKNSLGEMITLDQKKLGAGGEGDVFKISSPPKYSGYCAKIYFREKRIERRKKIEYMIQNPPINKKSSRFIICWPEEILYDGNEFIGFIMPLAYTGSIELFHFVGTKLPNSLGSQWTSKFDRTKGAGIESRLKICVNLCTAIHGIHLLNQFVIVDLKPHNILVDNTGNVSVIDCDSVQISQNGKVIFPARVSTPEYSPVESQKIHFNKDYVKTSWDDFSLAVILYEILFGIHPYTATFNGIYAENNSIDSKIKNGLYVHGKKKQFLLVLPKPHSNFHIIPKELQILFDRAFDKGHIMADVRPRAEEWGKTIYELVVKKK